MSAKLKTKSKSEKIVFAIATVFLNVWAVSVIYPVLFGINGALKENGRAFMANPVSLSTELCFSNFIKAFDSITVNDASFFRMALNSIVFSTVPSLVSLFITTAVAYAVSKYDKYRIMKYIYALILLVQIIPLYGTLPSIYKFYAKIGFLNSPLILIGSFGLTYSHFLYIYAFFQGVSWTYAEAARIDGAGHWKTFISVMLPQLLPQLSLLFILSFIAKWNNFEECLIYYSEAMPTLSYGIYVFEAKAEYMASQPLYFAGCILVSLPSFVIYTLLQDKIADSLYLGGIKG